jgi:hypothetical protein
VPRAASCSHTDEARGASPERPWFPASGWRARVGFGHLAPLTVVDRFRDGAGSTEGRLFGRARVFSVAGEHTTRSAAGRAALEAIWAPAALLPERGVRWRAESDEEIVAIVDVPPERAEVRLTIDEHGTVRSASALRWGKAGQEPSAISRAAAKRSPSVDSVPSSCRAR